MIVFDFELSMIVVFLNLGADLFFYSKPIIFFSQPFDLYLDMLYPTEVDSGRDGEIKEQERKLINLSLCGHRSVNKRANQKAFYLFSKD